MLKLGKVPHHPNEVHRIDLPEGIPKPPILGLFVGKRGQGKSTAAVRLLNHYTSHNPQVFHSNLTYVVSPTADSQFHLWDFCSIPHDNIFTASTAAEVKRVVDTISDKLREVKRQYDLDQEYLAAYEKLVNDIPLNNREEFILDERNAEPLLNPTPWPRPILILDDLSHLKVLDSKWFTSLCLRHRHVAGGVSLSMFIICQSLRGGVSRVVRQNCSLIVLFSTHDRTAVDDLYAECSHVLEEEEFKAIFYHATDSFHSFLAVDLTQTDPNRVFSRDFEHYYQVKLSGDMS